MPIKFVRIKIVKSEEANHFIDFYEVVSAEALELKPGDTVVLVHSGSRHVGTRIYTDHPKGEPYLNLHHDAVLFADANRRDLMRIVEEQAGLSLRKLFERRHNTLEVTDDLVIYRKGAMKILPGEYGIIPSSMTGKAALVRATDAVKNLENSLNHGTGRKLSIQQAKEKPFDPNSVSGICIPQPVASWALKPARAPHCYRTLEEVLPAMGPYVELVGYLKPKAHII